MSTMYHVLEIRQKNVIYFKSNYFFNWGSCDTFGLLTTIPNTTWFTNYWCLQIYNYSTNITKPESKVRKKSSVQNTMNQFCFGFVADGMFQVMLHSGTLTVELVTIGHFSFPVTGLLVNIKSQTGWTANLF